MKKVKKSKKKKASENDDSEEDFLAANSREDATKDFIFSDHDNSSGTEMETFEDSVETLNNDPKSKPFLTQSTPKVSVPDYSKRPANSPPLVSTGPKKQRS